MRLTSLLIFIATLLGCSVDSWKIEAIKGSGVQFEVPESFETIPEDKDLKGGVRLYDVRSRSNSGDYIRITVLEFPEGPEPYAFSQPLNCPDVPLEEVKEKSEKLLVAGKMETVIECKTRDRVGYLTVFVRGSSLITVTVSSKLENLDRSRKLLSKVGYKPNA